MENKFILKKEKIEITGEYAEDFQKLFKYVLGRTKSITITAEQVSKLGFYIRGQTLIQIPEYFYRNSAKGPLLKGLKSVYAKEFITFEKKLEYYPFQLPRKSVVKNLDNLVEVLPSSWDIDIAKYFFPKSKIIEIVYPTLPKKENIFLNMNKFLGLTVFTNADSIFLGYFLNEFNSLEIKKKPIKSAIIDYLKEKQKNEKKDIEKAIKVSILKWINKSLTGIEEGKLTKKGIENFENFYFNKECDHKDKNILEILPELEEKNGEYFCSHGNSFCRHLIEYEKLEQTRINEEEINSYMAKYGEKLKQITICRLCGAKLPFSQDNVFISFTSSYSPPDEEKSLLYRDILFAFASLSFKNLKTDEWKKKFISSITNELYPKLSVQIKKIKKKNISEEHYIAHLKILNLLFVFAFLIGFVNKNSKEIKFKSGHFGDNYKAIFESGKTFFKNSAGVFLQKIRDYSSINVSNVLQTMIDSINFFDMKEDNQQKPTYIIEKVKNPFLQEYLKNPILVPVYSKIRRNKNDFIIEVFYNPLLKKYEQKDKSGEKLLYNKYFSVKLQPQLSFNENYISYLRGTKNGIHDHVWTEILVNGKKKNLLNVEIGEKGTKLFCGICGLDEENCYGNIIPQIKDEFIKNEKLSFYKNFCPEKIKHKIENKTCIYCGYPKENFLKTYKLIQLVPEPVVETIKELKVSKYETKNITPNFTKSSLKRQEFENFWSNLGLYDDYEYTELLLEKQNGTSILNLVFIYFYLKLWIQKNINFIANDMPDPKENKKKLLEISKKMPANVSCLNSEKEVKFLIIEFFNELPGRLAEEFFSKLLSLHKNGAKTPANISAKNLIGAIDNEINEDVFLEGNENLDENNDFNDEQVDFDEDFKGNLQVE